MNKHTENAIWIGLNNDCYSREDVEARIKYLDKNGSNKSSEEARIACSVNLTKIDWVEVEAAI